MLMTKTKAVVLRAVKYGESGLVVDMLTEALGDEYPPLGMALMMKGRHMCKESRGARKDGYMISTSLTGVFKSDLRVRNEFMSYIKEWRP